MTDLELAHIIRNNTRVILPQFGAFLQKKNDDGQFDTKGLTFSVFLRHNDNFLEAELAKMRGCGIDQASKEVASYIQHLTQNLAQTGQYPIEGIGVLTREGSQVQLRMGDASAPLPTAVPPTAPPPQPATDMAQPKPQSTPKPAPKPAPKPSTKAPAKPQRQKPNGSSWLKRIAAMLVFVAVSVAIIIGIAYIIRYTVFAPQISIDRPEPIVQRNSPSSQAPPSSNSNSKDAIDQEFERMPTDNSATPKEQSTPKQPQSIEERIEQSVQQSAAEKGKPTQPAAAAAAAATTTNADANFYLIVGSFREQANADKLAAELTNKGMNSVVIKRPNDTYIVSLGTYSTREQANEAKQQHSNAFPAAWVMSRPQ